MKPVILIIILALFTANKVDAQKDIFFKSRPVDSLRYHNYKGSPYLYKTWKPADIESRDGTFYKKVLLNYNGYEQTFEVAEQHSIRTLSEDLYDTITVYLEESHDQREWFIRGLHYDIATSLANVIYQSDSIKLIRFFHVRVSETSNEIYGDNTIHRKFVQSRQYGILFRSKLTTGKMSWYRLGVAFGDQQLVDQIIKKNKLKLSKEEDLVKFMSIIDRQLH